MAKRVNKCLKTRPFDNPYEIWKGTAMMTGGELLNFEWRVLKKWQIDDDKPYARWFCAVKTEATFGEWEYGDEYVANIKAYGTKVSSSAS
jgi:hypothetical protein